jgi:CubicO group peptidase (beta-lactamase class C family)
MNPIVLAMALIATPAASSAGERFASGEVEPAMVGMDASRLRRVDRLIEEAIRKQITPGAAIAIGRHGQLVRMRGYGRTAYGRNAPRVTESTIYDIASLTKAVGTTSAAMLLVQQGRLDLDLPLSTYFDEWQDATDRASMSARHLLSHTSGLPPGGPLTAVGGDRQRIAAVLATIPMRNRPGARYEYSDYGLILMGALIERITGERLDVFLERDLFGPLALQETGFNPLYWGRRAGPSPFRLTSGAAPLAAIAPTERSPKRGLIHGVVHDPIAYRLDGVAGHAGLFSSVRDLAVFAELIRAGGVLGEARVFDADVLSAFTRRQSHSARHALGWELAREDGPSGSLFSETSFGHTGFTGTSIFIDPEHDLFVVLLTNRLHPNARERRHLDLRRAIHDAVIEALL